MCNLSEVMIEKGRKEGLEEGKLQTIKAFIDNGGTAESAKKMLNATDEQISAALNLKTNESQK